MRRVALLLTLALVPSTALAKKKKKKQPVMERVKAEAIGEIIRQATPMATIDQSIDSVGDPILRVKSGDLGYMVNFYDCTPEGCAAAQFRAWWTLEESIPLAMPNTFNQQQRVGRAYIDSDEDPVFELLVELAGGVTRAHLVAAHRTFLNGAQGYEQRLVQIVND